MKTGFVARFLVVAALSGASKAFAPQPLSKASTKSFSTTWSTTSTSLNVWNPFVKQDAPVEPVVIVKEDPEPGPFETKNYIAGAVWASLVVWAFAFAPGEMGSAADNAMITTLITQPTPRPEGLNELWFAVWNCFAVVPALLGALEAPVGRGQRLPAAPFLLGSAAFGFFALGPYFATRTQRTEPVDPEDLGFASKNIFENKIFGAALSLLALSIPFSSDLIGCDISSALSGYVDLASQSRFVAVASIDIIIMSTLAAVLVAEDAARRGWEDISLPLGIGSLLLPVIGPSVYLVARPSLEERQ